MQRCGNCRRSRYQGLWCPATVPRPCSCGYIVGLRDGDTTDVELFSGCRDSAARSATNNHRETHTPWLPSTLSFFPVITGTIFHVSTETIFSLSTVPIFAAFITRNIDPHNYGEDLPRRHGNEATAVSQRHSAATSAASSVTDSDVDIANAVLSNRCRVFVVDEPPNESQQHHAKHCRIGSAL